MKSVAADGHGVFFGLQGGAGLYEPRIWPSSPRPRAWRRWGGVLACRRRRGAASAEQPEQLLRGDDQQPEGKVGGDFDGATDAYVAASMIVV